MCLHNSMLNNILFQVFSASKDLDSSMCCGPCLFYVLRMTSLGNW